MNISKKRKELVLSKTKGRCFYCDHATYDHLDHMIPKSRGGHNGEDNLVPACISCNLLKGDLTPDEFMAKIFGKTMALQCRVDYFKKILLTYKKRKQNG